MTRDDAFLRERAEAFDKVILRVEDRLQTAPAGLVLDLSRISPEALGAGAEREVWSLFSRGLRHLKDGAPKGQPGSMAEALSRTSLRAGTLAAALGIKPPRFEPIYFSVDYSTGGEAALFSCFRLVEAAEEDLPKSRHALQQGILAEKAAEDLKRQMAAAFETLAETYARACREIKADLSVNS